VKVAFTTSGNDLNAPLEVRFGRTRNFLIYDLETSTFTVIDNRQFLDAAQGAGIQAAGVVARSAIEALVTGHCGPRAFRVLAATGIRVFNTDAATVRTALEKFRAARLVEAHSADVEGHWA
jgi:predicted Fe-Mo cluster-binding NifX family protein